MTDKILFVDDEPAVLRSYKRLMGLDYNLDIAEGAEQGLQLLEKRRPILCSDIRHANAWHERS